MWYDERKPSRGQRYEVLLESNNDYFEQHPYQEFFFLL